MTPVLQATTPAQEAYNRSFGATRATIERAFGVLKRRFRLGLWLLKYPYNFCLKKTDFQIYVVSFIFWKGCQEVIIHLEIISQLTVKSYNPSQMLRRQRWNNFV